MSENSNGSVKEVMPNTEVVAKAKRKQFHRYRETADTAGSGSLPRVRRNRCFAEAGEGSTPPISRPGANSTNSEN